MTFRINAPIDSNQHKGLLAVNSINGNPLALTGLSLTNAQPLHVAIVDGSGSQITTFGGGTQYANGTAVATPTGTVALGFDGANVRALKVDSSGVLSVTGGGGGTQYAELATTTPATGTLAFGRNMTTQPTLTDGQMFEPMLDTRANLKTVLYANNTSTTASFQADNTDAVAVSATANKLTIVSRNTVYNGTTWDRMPGTTSGVTIAQATAANLNATVVGTGTFAVQAAQTGTWNIATVTAVTAITNALPAGSNVIGHVITDTGSTTAVTGTVTISGAVTNAGTFAVQATLAAETTKVIGVVRTADGSGNLLTSTTNALDVNIKTSAASNISTNIAQMNGVTVTMGNGASGTGVQRVTLASDSTGQSIVPASATAVGATTVYTNAMTTKTAVNASAGNLYGYVIFNPNTVVAFVQVFNVASAGVTLGTTAPNLVIPVPPQGYADAMFTVPVSFGTALTAAATTTSNGASTSATGLNVTFIIK